MILLSRARGRRALISASAFHEARHEKGKASERALGLRRETPMTRQWRTGEKIGSEREDVAGEGSGRGAKFARTFFGVLSRRRPRSLDTREPAVSFRGSLEYYLSGSQNTYISVSPAKR